jgi:GR25 family glycosyltransferase involved in LPS biosynthesis
MINTFFDKIYCINLDERTDRWELAEKELESVGITNYIRFSAIKNENGAIGCRDSHIEVIKHAKKNNYNRILIFEDDFIFINKNQELINKTLTQLEKINYDIFYFGATLEKNYGILKKIDENIVNTNFAYALHAYSVNPRCYDFIINEGSKYPIIDVFVQSRIVSRGNCYIANPMLCLQRADYSDIEKKDVDYVSMMSENFNTVLNKNL